MRSLLKLSLMLRCELVSNAPYLHSETWVWASPPLPWLPENSNVFKLSLDWQSKYSLDEYADVTSGLGDCRS
jgi:hypothetical protein